MEPVNPDLAIVVSATVVTEDEGKAARALEAFSRVSTGLALEGLLVSLTISRDEGGEVSG